jgi:Ala-tRNA(Pro) deacylase
MDAPTLLDRPNPRLLEWLARARVDYDIHEHPRASTATETAVAERIDPRTFAKVVGVRARDGRTVLLVLDATDRVDLDKARRALAATDVRLLSEAEMTTLAPDCEVGAIPAVGQLFGVAMIADHAVREDPMISFNAGSHSFSVRVDRPTWERACSLVYADIALDTDAPAWAGS